MGLAGIFFFLSYQKCIEQTLYAIYCAGYNSDELDSDPVCMQISLMRGPDVKPGSYLKDNVYVW